jgi:hypothetical protein
MLFRDAKMAFEHARTALDLAGQAGDFIVSRRHRLYVQGCGLPKLGDQLPVLRESLQELVADVVRQRSSPSFDHQIRLDGISQDSNSA